MAGVCNQSGCFNVTGHNDTLAQVDNLAAELDKFNRLAELCITCNVGLNQASAGFLWTTTLLFLLSTIIVLFSSVRIKPGRRGYYFILFYLFFTEMIAYLLMALSHGRTYVEKVELTQSNDKIVPVVRYLPANPPIFYARYIAWALGNPLMISLICRFVGASADEFLAIVTLSICHVVCLAVATLSERTFLQHWVAWFASILFWLGCVWHFQTTMSSRCRAKGDEQVKSFLFLKWYIVILLGVYNLIWMLAEGSQTMSVNAEAIIYSLLDFFGKFGFGVLFLYLLPPAQPPVSIRRSDNLPSTARQRLARSYHLRALELRRGATRDMQSLSPTRRPLAPTLTLSAPHGDTEIDVAPTRATRSPDRRVTAASGQDQGETSMGRSTWKGRMVKLFRRSSRSVDYSADIEIVERGPELQKVQSPATDSVGSED